MRSLTTLVQKLDHIIRIEELSEMLGVDRSTIWRWSTDEYNDFPNSIQLSPKMKGWLNSEVNTWLISKKRKKHQIKSL